MFPNSSSSTSRRRKDSTVSDDNNSSKMSSLRNIGRMGQSALMSSNNKKDNKEKDQPQQPSEDDDDYEKDMIDHTPLPTLNISKQVWQEQQDNLFMDILQVRHALDLFLDSRIPEAERILEPKRRSTLYHSLGYSFILFLKSMMTFQHTDIEAAIQALKETLQLADGLRKRETSWLGNITSWVKGVSVHNVVNMSTLHRHAELVYAESYLLKALLCIIHDESIVSFLREGLHVRSSYNTYKTLQNFLLHIQQEQQQQESCEEIDHHFTSGVALGVGLFNLMISLLPTSVVKLVEFIGFTSDRTYGMNILESVGGWNDIIYKDKTPPLQEPNEGLRRQFCDMSLMAYHIILSKLIPLSHVNEALSDRILDYSLTLYPHGVFFLFFSGRQLGARGQLKEAKSQYEKAIATQKDWKQLQHMCFWELGLINLLQQNWQQALDCYTTLQTESNWSKAVYTYLEAISLYTLATNITTKDKNQEEEKNGLLEKAGEMMEKVTSAKQKIAGKSIPLEKFVARKARKFIAQNNRLLFADLEALNAFSAFDFMSMDLLYNNLDRITNEITRLTSTDEPEEVLNYYDDLVLSHYLRVMILRLLIEKSHHDDKKVKEWKTLHQTSIECVMKYAQNVQLDHYVYYFTRYEEARMLIIDKKYPQAQDIVASIIKTSEKNQFNVGAGPHAKNKYSLENTLLFKCHNCLTEITTLTASCEEN